MPPGRAAGGAAGGSQGTDFYRVIRKNQSQFHTLARHSASARRHGSKHPLLPRNLHMRLPHHSLQLIILFALLLPLLANAAEPIAPLSAPPLGERWYSVIFGDERS